MMIEANYPADGILQDRAVEEERRPCEFLEIRIRPSQIWTDAARVPALNVNSDHSWVDMGLDKDDPGQPELPAPITRQTTKAATAVALPEHAGLSTRVTTTAGEPNTNTKTSTTWALLGMVVLLGVVALGISRGGQGGETTAPTPAFRRALQATGQQQYKQAATPAVQYRGVNLGGWLVLESWMYPEWWNTTGVPTWQGEWQFVEKLGKDKARTLLEKHWDTWVTRKELEDLKAAGIQHLRIPIGYWILGEPFLRPNEQYVVGGWPYLLRALGWCKELGLQAIIDLHGAPGVQNSNDNSGFSGPHEAIHWHEPENLQRTNEVLVYLAKNLTAVNATEQYKGSVLGLCLINEPWTTAVGGPIQLQTVKDWAQTAVDAVLAAGWKGHIWYPDGFSNGWDGWTGFLAPPKYQNVFADAHIYMLFDPALQQLGPADQGSRMCHGYYAGQLTAATRISSGVVVGEYSLDYPTYPYDNQAPTGDMKASLQTLLLAQQKTFGMIGDQAGTGARGGFFWSFKSLGRVQQDFKPVNNQHSPWSYLALIQDGIATDLSKASFDCNTLAATAAGNNAPASASTTIDTNNNNNGGKKL